PVVLVAAGLHERGVDPTRERDRRSALRLRCTLRACRELASETRQRPAALRAGAPREVRVEVPSGRVDLSRADARGEPELDGARMELLRVGEALLEAVELLEDGGVVRRRRGRGDGRAEERGASGERLVRRLAREGAQLGENGLPVGRTLPEADHTTLE